nr:DUF6291 domain-containing protein [uncultured Ruminococcus sp.]
MNSSQEPTKKPPYFYFYTKYFDFINLLSDEEVGQVIKYIGEYIQQYGTDNTAAAQAKSENVKVVMLCTMFEQDINNAFKKYFAQCKNGAKGGAPKGNKNAAKKDSKKSLESVETSEDNARMATIVLIILEEKEGETKKKLKIPQIADFAACIFLLDDFRLEIGEFEEELGYKTIYSYILDKGATTAIKELKRYTKEQWEDSEENTLLNFNEIYSNTKEKALFFLSFDEQELNKFYDKCNPDTTTENTKPPKNETEGQPAPKPEFSEIRKFYKDYTGFDDAYLCDEFVQKMDKNGVDWNEWESKLLAYAIKTGELNE